MKISLKLIDWYLVNKRRLPWRDTKDPYHIWLSEVILQQTRVQQGLPYYLKFVEHYPSITDLAKADEQEVLSHWQGLGYYSRARNMHAAAKKVTFELDGFFPTTYKSIKELKGVGDYTASAIGSFAFGLPTPVIDGNVLRVISRLFAIQLPIDKPIGQKAIRSALVEIFDENRPADFNQAIMEFGSLQCKPTSPDCTICCLQVNCLAYERGQVSELPKKEGKTKVKHVEHHYFYFIYKDKCYIEKRTKGIWTNLHQFPLIEGELADISSRMNIFLKNSEAIHHIKKNFSTVHLLSHRKIQAHFYEITLDKAPIFSKSNIFEITIEELGSKYPTSVLTQKFINQLDRDDK